MADNLNELIPGAMEGLDSIGASIFEKSDLDPKTIELIILAYGIAKQCEGCINFHVKKLVDLGVTENEIATVIGVGVLMGGGPGSAYGEKALARYNELTK